MNLPVFNDNIGWCHRCPNGETGHCKISGRSIVEHARETSCPIDRYGSILVRSTDSADKVVAALKKPLFEGEKWHEWSNVQEGYRRAMASFASKIGEAPEGNGTTGIVIAAGGIYFDSAYVTIRIIRELLNCDLPVEVWHLGPDEMLPWMLTALESLNVTTHDALAVGKKIGTRLPPTGYRIKSLALTQTTLQHVLFLDADAFPLVNPMWLFQMDRYLEKGAVFFKDQPRFDLPKRVWEIFGVQSHDEAGFEMGQFVIDTQKHYRELQLWRWLDDHSEYYYDLKHQEWVGLGDCLTAHLAFRYFNDSEFAYASAERWRVVYPAVVHRIGGHDWFVHRINRKLSLDDEQKGNEVFRTTSQAAPEDAYNDEIPLEAHAWGYLHELKAFAPERVEKQPEAIPVAIPDLPVAFQPHVPPMAFRAPPEGYKGCSGCKRKAQSQTGEIPSPVILDQ